MKKTSLFLLIFIYGCGLSSPEINPPDTNYKEALNDNFNGYASHDNNTEIWNGAKKFVSCINQLECDFLWDIAKEWITKKSNYRGTLLTNTTNLLVTNPGTKKEILDQISFEVAKIPNNNKENIIKISAKCSKNCKNYVDYEYFAFNNYLRKHLLAYRDGAITYNKNSQATEDSSIKNTDPLNKLDIDVSDLTNQTNLYELDENLLKNRVEIKVNQKEKYFGKVSEQLISKYSCKNPSKISLLKKTGDKELYEVSCIKEVKRMVFDCNAEGCEVLQ